MVDSLPGKTITRLTMKSIVLRFAPLLVCLSLLAGCTLFFPGCALGGVELDPAGPSQGDKVEYNFKLAVVTKHRILQAFLDWERDNAPLLVNQPKVRALAAKVRAEAPAWFQEADRHLVAYEAIPRLPENAGRIAQARRALLAALVVINLHQNQANAAMLDAASTK